MAFSLLLSKFFKISDAVANVLRQLTWSAQYPLPAVCGANGLPSHADEETLRPDDTGDGFLWAVPHKRRTIERRMWRRIGHPYYQVVKKHNIRTCEVCGHFHLLHTICGNCYKKVKEETELMREAIEKELKLDPVEKEVVVLYQDDPREESADGRIVELPRQRPAWFSKNLLTKAYAPLSKASDSQKK